MRRVVTELYKILSLFGSWLLGALIVNLIISSLFNFSGHQLKMKRLMRDLICLLANHLLLTLSKFPPLFFIQSLHRCVSSSLQPFQDPAGDILRTSPEENKIVGVAEMATTSATLSPATFTPTAVAGRSGNSSRRKGNVVYIGGMNSFGGLKAQNSVLSLGLPVSAEQSFAQVMNSLKSSGGRGGGALSSTCNAVAEIFKIAGIMNALVLVGVAVGFVLLRIEASLEEE